MNRRILIAVLFSLVALLPVLAVWTQHHLCEGYSVGFMPGYYDATNPRGAWCGILKPLQYFYFIPLFLSWICIGLLYEFLIPAGKVSLPLVYLAYVLFGLLQNFVIFLLVSKLIKTFKKRQSL